ncbi:MAG: hypothetical protein NTX53_18780 [candidate division WOR-3 bacterium]|nr:hypothetical protein [candidate division WOR-3 bacterium]
MTRSFSIAVLLLAVLSMTAFGQSQQVIQLKDGSSVKGEVINQDETKLLVRTEYGTLEIPKTNVLSIGYGEVPKPAAEATQSGMQAEPASIPQSTQRDAISQGSILVRGGLQYVNTSGEGLSGSVSQFTLSPSVAFFLSRGTALGFDGSLVSSSSGGYSQSVSMFGPNGTYLFGKMNSSAYFHCIIGVGLFHVAYSGQSASADAVYLKFAAGITPVIRRHLGIPIEAQFMALRESTSGTTATQIGLGVGLEGFIF